jgi:hypothetical protein
MNKYKIISWQLANKENTSLIKLEVLYHGESLPSIDDLENKLNAPEIPFCNNCGDEWINDSAAEKLDGICKKHVHKWHKWEDISRGKIKEGWLYYTGDDFDSKARGWKCLKCGSIYINLILLQPPEECSKCKIIEAII